VAGARDPLCPLPTFRLCPGDPRSRFRALERQGDLRPARCVELAFFHPKGRRRYHCRRGQRLHRAVVMTGGCEGGDQHARGAEAALHGAMTQERLLEWVQRFVTR